MAVYKPEDELSWNNREEVLKLPVAPKDPPELYTPGQNQTWNTTDAGPFKAIGYPGLYGVTIESFFPAHNYPFCTYTGFPSPEECVEMIKRWQESRRPIRYIRTGLINDAFAIEGFSYSKETGTGDINYRLELERYPFADQENPETGNSYRDGTDLNDDGVVDQTVTYIALKKGTTLCELAEEWLGDADRYNDIYEWNKDTMNDPGHPWNYEMEAAGQTQQVKLELKEGEPGYDRVVYSYTGKHAEDL
nr:MAG TPA: tail assembly protein [Caudoviricetes sp.]